MIIRESAFPRAALVGNPSDGYHGKTVAFVFNNYSADITLYETPDCSPPAVTEISSKISMHFQKMSGFTVITAGYG